MPRLNPRVTVTMHTRLDLETQERRVRLQDILNCATPELVQQALLALEEKLAGGRNAAA